jgi:hypothetical protein
MIVTLRLAIPDRVGMRELRLLLKALLRRHGIRCIGIREERE